MKRNSKRINAGWKCERVEGSAALWRLIGPVAQQKDRRKTICVAIGSKRLRKVAAELNALGLLV